MNFWEHCLRLLRHRPLQALVALYWHLTRRRVRARNRLRVASADLPFAYAVWIANNENSSKITAEDAARWEWRPRFSILLHNGQHASELDRKRSLASLDRQIYPEWGIVDATTKPIAMAITECDGDYIIPLCVGDALSEGALFHFAGSLQAKREATILYGDEDRLDPRGRRGRPWFKPGWNEELFLAQDYLSSAAAIETTLAKTLKSVSNVPELVLAATIEGRKVVHVPHVLCHVAGEPIDYRERLQAIASVLKPTGAHCEAGPFETIKVIWPLPDALPLVSIVIPTKDKLEVLKPCVESVIERTAYRNFEIIIVDNGSVEERTLEFLRQVTTDTRAKVLSYPGPFNYSAINNFAVSRAAGSFLCLLNNDTEVVKSNWLHELMRFAVRPKIGAAGAKLLYDDGSIQHAGVIVGIGEAAGHPHRFLPNHDPGYFRMPHVSQFVSAVTGACLVVEKGKFEAVGGFDELDLAVAFNDVDLCLKLQAEGWRNVYVPHAVLLHHESRSRGSDMAPEQVERYRRELAALQERWDTKTFQDPLHNPNLDRYSETFVFRI